MSTTWTLNLTIPSTGNTLAHTWVGQTGTPTAKVGDALTVVLTNPPQGFTHVTLNLSWASGAGNPNPAVVGWNGFAQNNGQIQWTGFLLNPTTSLQDPKGAYTFRVIVTVNPASSSPTTYEVDPKMIVEPG